MSCLLRTSIPQVGAKLREWRAVLAGGMTTATGVLKKLRSGHIVMPPADSPVGGFVLV